MNALALTILALIALIAWAKAIPPDAGEQNSEALPDAEENSASFKPAQGDGPWSAPMETAT